MIGMTTKEKSKKVLARDIVNWIKEGTVQYERDRQDRESGREGDSRERFYARDLGGCTLRVYFRRCGFPSVPHERVRLLDLARRGSDLERLVTDFLGASPAKLSSCQERCVRTHREQGIEATVAGRCDAVLDGAGPIEVKSVGTEEFSELRSIAEVRARRPAHVDQCLVYCWLFDVPQVFLLYANRDDAKYRCFCIKREIKREKELLAEIIQTEKAIQEKAPPDPKPGIPCYFCEYRDAFCPAFGGSPDPTHAPAGAVGGDPDKDPSSFVRSEVGRSTTSEEGLSSDS